MPFPSRPRRPAAVLLSLALTLPYLGTSCKTEQAAGTQGDAGVVKMPIGRGTFTLEVADTPRKQQLGLMHRKSMPQDHGMLFVFDEEEERSFWMKNTLIPLDIIYADAAGRVVSVKQMQPLDESSVPSDGPAKYAVELNQGAAARAGVKRGDVLAIPDEARDPGGRRGNGR